MPRVFVTNYNPDFDYESASELGELVYMTEGFVPPSNYKSAERKFAAFASASGPDDLLLLSGANVLVAIAVARWLDVHSGVTVLQHTKRRGESGRMESAYTSFLIETNE
jgi:hypothetical protein